MSRRKRTIVNDLFKANEALTIRQLLQIPSEYRSYQHCKMIIDHVKDVKFLERYMENNQIYDLAKEFQLKSFEANTAVFNQGDDADMFYIILSGSVRVLIPAPPEVKHFNNLREVMKLKRGDAFGELALLFDSVRSATIITEERTEFITLDKDSFRKHIKTISTTHIGKIVDFFKEFPAFQHLDSKQIAKYASKSLFYKFPSNTVLAREGDNPHEIFFIKSGRVKVIRRINFKINPYTKNLSYDDPSEPTPLDIQKGLYKSLLVEIDELSNGDSFCDYAVLNNLPMHHSIVCSIPCELIALPCYDLEEFDTEIINGYRTICKPYPDDTELRKVYLDVSRWNNWKKNLCENVQIEKINKRRGFNQQLREPFLKSVKMEKLSIPVESTLDSNLLKIINQNALTTRATKVPPLDHTRIFATARSSYTSRQKHNSNEPSTKRSGLGLLPQIGKSTNNLRESSDSRLGVSGLNQDSSQLNRPRKFEFVIPQHRLIKKEEIKTARDHTNELEYDIEKPSGFISSSNEIKLPYPYNSNDLPIPQNKLPTESDESRQTDATTSIPGTKDLARTFSKVFDQIGIGDLYLPGFKK